MLHVEYVHLSPAKVRAKREARRDNHGERKREREIFRERSRSPICKHTCIAIDEPVRELGGRVGGVRSRVTSRSVAVFAYLLRIACCVTFLTSERASKKSRGRIPRARTMRRGASIIIGREEIKRSLRGPAPALLRGERVSVPCSWRDTYSLVHSFVRSLARGREINNYRGGREC